MNPAIRHLFATLCLASLCAPLQAADGHGHAAHVHGQGKLNVSLQGDTLTIALESPLDNLLGFERKPKFTKDFEAVKAMATTLRAADNLFVPSAAAQCTRSAVKLTSSAIEPALLGESGPAAQGASDDHADLDAEFVFRCAKPAELKSVEVKLFDAFKRFRVLQTQLVTDKRQAAAKLTPKARTLSM